MAEPDLTDHGDEMEGKLDQLGEHIQDAEKELAARREDADVVDAAAGQPEGEQDASGGEDPEGAGNDVSGEEGGPPQADDELVEEEAQSPT